MSSNMPTALDRRLMSSAVGMAETVSPCCATRPVSVITTASSVLMATGTSSTWRNVALDNEGDATMAT